MNAENWREDNQDKRRGKRLDALAGRIDEMEHEEDDRKREKQHKRLERMKLREATERAFDGLRTLRPKISDYEESIFKKYMFGDLPREKQIESYQKFADLALDYPGPLIGEGWDDLQDHLFGEGTPEAAMSIMKHNLRVIERVKKLGAPSETYEDVERCARFFKWMNLYETGYNQYLTYNVVFDPPSWAKRGQYNTSVSWNPHDTAEDGPAVADLEEPSP